MSMLASVLSCWRSCCCQNKSPITVKNESCSLNLSAKQKNLPVPIIKKIQILSDISYRIITHNFNFYKYAKKDQMDQKTADFDNGQILFK